MEWKKKNNKNFPLHLASKMMILMRIYKKFRENIKNFNKKYYSENKRNFRNFGEFINFIIYYKKRKNLQLIN